MDVDERVEALARDRRRGASEIADDAVDVLAACAETGRDRVVDAATRLVEAHPAMAPLVHVADQVLRGWEAEGPEVVDRLRDEAERRRAALTEAVADLIDDGTRVVTYSRSGTVLAGLSRAAEDRTLSLVVSEGRPGMEGVDVAGDLADRGVDVTLTTDAALGAFLDDADLLLIGADALCAAGVVNKVGSAGLCRGAGDADVGVIVAAGTDKILPAAYAACPPLAAQGDLDVAVPEGVTVDVPLFEVVDWEQPTAVVTEDGPVPTSMLVDRIRERPIAEELTDVVEGRDGG